MLTEAEDLRRISNALDRHLRRRQGELIDEESIESLSYILRMCKRAGKAARRAHRDEAGIDRAETHLNNESDALAVNQALAFVPWRGAFNGRFMAQHFTDDGQITVLADSIPQLLALIASVDVGVAA